MRQGLDGEDVDGTHDPLNTKVTVSFTAAVMLFGLKTNPPEPTVTVVTAAEAADATDSATRR